MSAFERFLERPGVKTAFYWRGAMIEICDTAEGARAWLSDFYPDHTAADVVALVGLIKVREAELISRGDDLVKESTQ